MGETTGSFQFVQVGQTGLPKNADDRKTVRRAAMRAFRRQERIERVKAFTGECAEVEAIHDKTTTSHSTTPVPTNDLSKARTSGFTRSLLAASKSSEKSTWSKQNSTTYGKISFTTQIPRAMRNTPGILCGGMYDTAYVFDYFIFEIVSIMLPFDGHNQRLLRAFFSSNLMRDPTILQAALCHAAVHIDVVNDRKPSKLAIMLTKQAIRAINQKLATKSLFVENDLIAAVAMIALNSNLTGDVAESQIHMEALKEMVRMKGGRDNLGDDGFVRTLLSWADVTSASLIRSKPRFVICDPNDVPSELTMNQFPPSHIGRVFALTNELRALTVLKQSIDSSTESTIQDIMDFDAQRNALEEQVLTLQYTFSTIQGLGFGDVFLEACCIASSIYMQLVFRNFGPNFVRVRESKQDLMATLLKAEALFASMSDLIDTGFSYAEKLLWSLVIGSTCALNAAETIWFANCLTLVVPWTHARSWEDVEACLNSVLWNGKLRNAPCIAMWDQVESNLGFNSGMIVEEDVIDTSVVFTHRPTFELGVEDKLHFSVITTLSASEFATWPSFESLD